ncbi:DNA recombination protein RmuC [Limoniibacter endophyticus]|uniref:DNA recombination protein RmuC homolog n=1 Tax=Limoniibacter endophyticus TaxID=1565040 RepID=A0A8J3GHN3_9HYPH|nr:DNA recombination protein RmuC [Limoniibacter endophyticus]GHC67310.1 DNA recombinase [Limoniibacter endophyticus]
MENISSTLEAQLFGPVTLGMALAFALLAIILLCLSAAVRLWRGEDRENVEDDPRVEAILRSQAEMQGRLGTMAEIFGSRQAELNRSLTQRLDSMAGRIGQSMTDQQRATHENLSRLQARLAVIDTAQSNIQSLAGQVVELQSILSNKQTRGAFGQARMETIIADALPPGAYEFQAGLSNGARPDCTVRMPNGAPSLVIDAKFPLESWNAMRKAETPEIAKIAAQNFRRDMDVHIRAIAEKYLIAGETQDTAFLFVPSESIFADIHEQFESIVQRAHRARVVIVSPSLLLLSVQVIQAILKDARMREQAHLIQAEVAHLTEDMRRLDERVAKLRGHFDMTARDIDSILVSTSKVIKRGEKIEALELGEKREATRESETAPAPRKAEPAPEPAAKSRTGNLRLRLVDGED